MHFFFFHNFLNYFYLDMHALAQLRAYLTAWIPGGLQIRSSPTFDLLALPRPLALTIISLLPVDTRLRSAEVCRGWRALLWNGKDLWSELDFAGVSVFNEALLAAAVAKAGGSLVSLDVSTVSAAQLSAGTLKDVVVSSAHSLRRVAAMETTYLDTLELLMAAPFLETLVKHYGCGANSASFVLRGEGVFKPLRMRSFTLYNHEVR